MEARKRISGNMLFRGYFFSRWSIVCLGLCCGLLSLPSAAATPSIKYSLAMPEPWTHLFRVRIDIDRLPEGQASVDLQLPTWRSGRYVIFDFAGSVVEFSAVDGAGQPLDWMKTDKSTWKVTKGRSTALTVTYSVYADDFLNRTRGLNDRHGFVDGSAVFMFVQDLRALPVTLAVEPYGGWHVTTGLDSIPGERHRFLAPTYDDLIDSPLEIGTQRDYDFLVEGKPHVISIYGPLNCNIDSLKGEIATIVTMNARFWGSLPYSRYVFLFHAGPGSGGGTEHLNSAVLDVSADPSPAPRSSRSLRGLIGHEFFHTWNVKQFRPRGMDPYILTGEIYPRELWIVEGSTSYMHNLLQVRTGLTAVADFVRGLANAVQDERRRPGNRVQSVAQCSFDIWIRPSNPAEAVNFTSDIYAKGAQVSLCLDLEIRQRSGNRHSFDDLLKNLLARFPRGSGGYTLGDVRQIAGELAGSPMDEFFSEYVEGVTPLRWEQMLGYAGLRVDTVVAPVRRWLGVALSDASGRALVKMVFAGSPAYRDGINAGDEIVALDGHRVDGTQLTTRIGEYAPRDTVRITLLREDQLRELQVILDSPEPPSYSVRRVDTPTPLQRAIYSSWLNDPW